MYMKQDFSPTVTVLAVAVILYTVLRLWCLFSSLMAPLALGFGSSVVVALLTAVSFPDSALVPALVLNDDRSLLGTRVLPGTALMAVYNCPDFF